MTPADLDALILAGGLGTRLRTVVPDTPKVLARVAGRPFVAHVLERLAQAGVRRAVLCTGFRATDVEQALGDRHGRLALAYSEEAAPLGTGGALHLGLALTRSEPVLALNGDSYCTADLGAFSSWHAVEGAKASLVVVPAPPGARRYGEVVVDGDRVTAFAEKPAAGAPQAWVSAGIYLLARDLLAAIPGDRAVSLEREILPGWAAAGVLGAHRTDARLLDIGTPESYAAAEAFFAKG